ncbi:hypothetical protein [Burkholderia orbicola]|nr:hypothetical protein [Burkholderia orbicola]MDN7558202.1 hypothetical protein [Burkholderia orbicola]
MTNFKHACQGALVAVAFLIVTLSIMNTVVDAADYLTRHVTVCRSAR